MEEEEFLEIKADTLEVFEEDVIQTLELHDVIQTGPPDGGTTVDATFGFVKTAPGEQPNTLLERLLFSQVLPKRVKDKKVHPAGDEFIGDYECKFYIPTADLDRKGIVLKRDSMFLKLQDGAEYRIEHIQPVPRMWGTSVVHKLFCSRRKPIDDNPGVNG